MLFHIDPNNGLALYEQIVRQVKFAVAEGVLARGELVPSVRELSKDLKINPNTISRAYRELQLDRVLEPVRGTGLEVATGAAERCRGERVKLIRARLRQVLAEARQSQLDVDELREMIDKELSSFQRQEK